MKHLNSVIVAAVLVMSMSFMSCSKDDKPVVKPSKVIESVDIYFGTGDKYERASTFSFIYDNNKLVKFEADKPLAEVNYTYYSADSLSYSIVSSRDGVTEWNKISAKLRDGKIKTCFSSRIGYMTYSYENNFVTGVIVGGGTVLDYDWNKGDLRITSTGLPSNGYYNTGFTSSRVSNEYSFDLNVLSLLVDGREDYADIMNVYGQMIGIIGAKSQYVLENVDYTYDYEYDGSGRLSSVSLLSKSSDISYSFKIRYKE